MQDFRSDRCQFEHFFVGNGLQLARAGHDARVGGVDAVDVGIDIAAVGLDRSRNRNRRRVGAAATQGGDAVVVGQALKAGNDGDRASAHRGKQLVGIDCADPRLGMGIIGVDRHLPAEPTPRIASQEPAR